MRGGSLLSVVALLCAVASANSLDSDEDGRRCPITYPRHLIAYHLESDEKITIDGRLDEEAWTAVGRSESFMDIQGPSEPKPRFETWMKFRWDDEFLYIGGYLEEPNCWANMTQHDSVVFNDNDFEVFIDPDASTHHYKEFEINAINTTWDLELAKPYIDGGSANNSWDMEGFMYTATYVNGPVNDPNAGTSKYWTVELALPHRFYVQQCFKATSPPRNRDLWRINFSRVEYHVAVNTATNTYEKVPGAPVDNWVWTSQDLVNMHLPERWGFLQFSTDPVNGSAVERDKSWPQRKALAEVYYAEHEFSAVSGYFTADLSQLTDYGLPDWVLDASCGTSTPNITLDHGFTAIIESMDDPKLERGNIQGDRLTWFGQVHPNELLARATQRVYEKPIVE